MSRFRNRQVWCAYCGKNCTQAPCEGAIAARKPPAKAEPIICAKCGEPGCWLRRTCPADEKERTGS